MQHGLMGIVHEGRGRLVDQRPGLAVGRGDLDHPQHLVAALVVQEREARRVGLPADVVAAPRLGVQAGVHGDLAAGRGVEQPRHRHRQPVAGLVVPQGVQLGLEPIPGGTLDERDGPAVAAAGPHRHEPAAVGRPAHGGVGVAVVLGSVGGEHLLVPAGRRAEHEVAGADGDDPTPVGGLGAARRAGAGPPRRGFGRRGSGRLLLGQRPVGGAEPPVPPRRRETDFGEVRRGMEALDRQAVGPQRPAQRLAQRDGDGGVVEGRDAAALGGVHAHELPPPAGAVPPEPQPVAARQPHRLDAVAEDQAAEALLKPGGALVVGSGALGRGDGAPQGGHQQRGRRRTGNACGHGGGPPQDGPRPRVGRPGNPAAHPDGCIPDRPPASSDFVREIRILDGPVPPPIAGGPPPARPPWPAPAPGRPCRRSGPAAPFRSSSPAAPRASSRARTSAGRRSPPPAA